MLINFIGLQFIQCTKSASLHNSLTYANQLHLTSHTFQIIWCIFALCLFRSSTVLSALNLYSVFQFWTVEEPSYLLQLEKMKRIYQQHHPRILTLFRWKKKCDHVPLKGKRASELKTIWLKMWSQNDILKRIFRTRNFNSIHIGIQTSNLLARR